MKKSRTGRLTAYEPAIQNIPVRTEEARRVADAFRTPVFVDSEGFDIELRFIADLFGKKPES